MAEISTTMENCDEENSVTMLDVLQEENQREEDANAVLGASDDKNCTYLKVKIKFYSYPLSHSHTNIFFFFTNTNR